MDKIVCKFGGTSLADAGQFRKVKEIIQADPRRKYIVASAPGKRNKNDIKVTDLLIRCYELAAEGMDYSPVLDEIESRFNGIIDELGIDISIEQNIERIDSHLKGYAEKSYMESRGEYLNSKILAAYLGFEFVDPYECVYFDDNGGLDHEITYRRLSRRLENTENAVIAGFYGRKANGEVATFSRGGSDITGSLVAEAVLADVYENWTDVSGLLAADPRIVKDPGAVDFISYRELRTLSYMGASVLHTDAVNPVSRVGIPINIRNTNCPEDEGTVILETIPDGKRQKSISGVAGRKGLSVVQIEKIMVSDGAGFTAVILDVFAKYAVPFEQCLTGIDTVSVVIRSDLFSEHRDEIIEDIRKTLKPDTLTIRENLAMVAVVGEDAVENLGETLKVLEAVRQAGIGISTINQGAGKLNLIIGVGEEDYEETIRVIYEAIR